MRTIIKTLTTAFLVITSIVSINRASGQTYSLINIAQNAASTTVGGNCVVGVTSVTGGGTTKWQGTNVGTAGINGTAGSDAMNCAAQTGMRLEMSGASSAWGNSITVTFTFTVPVLAPVTFNIFDLTEPLYSGDNSAYYQDKVTISATDEFGTAMIPNATIAGTVDNSVVGNSRVLVANLLLAQCMNQGITITGASCAKVKTITVVYSNQNPPTHAPGGKYGVTQYQYVFISNINYVNPPTVTLSASPTSICPPATSTLTATSGFTSYNWGAGNVANNTNVVAPVTTTTYTVTATNAAGCTATASTTVSVSSNVAPLFTNLGPYCVGASPGALPTTSTNSITGTWSPTTISTATAGTTTYTFTPTGGQCASTTTMSVLVNASATPTFIALGPYCAGQTPGVLPLTSTNSINGTWSPSTVSTATAGTTVYTFTPAGGQCATATTMSVTVNPSTTPTFTGLGPYCVNSVPAALPTTSNNGVAGTWNPAAISTATAGTVTYTFSPTGSPCANTATMAVVVNSSITPTFTALGPYCTGATPAALPATSNNGIAGTWNPATISTATAGNTIYTFTPTGSTCATTATMTVTVNASIAPTFTALGPYCVGTAPAALPLTSTNGVVGTWNPTTISTATAGTATYTFTPTGSTCATTATMTVTVSATITPTFTALGTYCVGATPATLPNTSNNGVTGTWNPTTISTATAGTAVYTFTPTGSNCATTATMSVTVSTQITPNFAAIPAFCGGTVAPTLGTTSPNGIVGTWNPAIISNTASGTYLFTPNAGQCASTQTLTVTVNPQTLSDFAAIPPFCDGTVAPLLSTTAPNGVTGTWNPSTINNTTSGTYTFTPTSGACPTNQVLTVTVIAPTLPNFAPIPSICFGGVAPILSNTSPNGIVGTWNPATINNTTNAVYIFTPNVGQCATSITLSSVINPMPTVTATASPDSICYGASSLLTAAGASTYTWMPGALSGVSVNVSPTSSTIYTVMGTSVGGCVAVSTVLVTLMSGATLHFTATPSEGCTPLTVQFHYIYDGTIDTTTLHWDFGDPSTTADVSNLLNPSYTYMNSGDFIVTLTGMSTSGCNAVGQTVIHVSPPPVADFYADPSITSMNQPLIHFYDESANANQWQWWFGEVNSNNSFEEFPEHTYLAPGNYPVTLIVYNGTCTDTITKYIIISEGFAYYIPSAFSPTADALNDVFNGKGIGFKTDAFEMSIYDRWGERIFSTNDSEKGWDGKVQGKTKICMGGIYVYKFKVIELNGVEHKYVGTVLLLR